MHHFVIILNRKNSILTDYSYASLHWDESGTEVVMESSVEVAKNVLHNHFNTSKYHSFTRQFHLYGFRRTTDGRKDKKLRGYCKFRHPIFQRDHPELLQSIIRVQPSKTHPETSPSPPIKSNAAIESRRSSWSIQPSSSSPGSIDGLGVAAAKVLESNVPDALTKIPPKLAIPSLIFIPTTNTFDKLPDTPPFSKTSISTLKDEFSAPKAQDMLLALQALEDHLDQLSPNGK
ncbi:hypothetical protein LPJ66_004743 [Kickxella alabastrina]|uniref:Uncharacterized protein n=1 Tax=Kickxella alabastrina TaxID=61397 RepID=A0ACC1IG63_9FUNG|nr:hypothetical protein LPJ66_004743 [Kickxella alabastrina]